MHRSLQSEGELASPTRRRRQHLLGFAIHRICWRLTLYLSLQELFDPMTMRTTLPRKPAATPDGASMLIAIVLELPTHPHPTQCHCEQASQMSLMMFEMLSLSRQHQLWMSAPCDPTKTLLSRLMTDLCCCSCFAAFRDRNSDFFHHLDPCYDDEVVRVSLFVPVKNLACHVQRCWTSGPGIDLVETIVPYCFHVVAFDQKSKRKTWSVGIALNLPIYCCILRKSFIPSRIALAGGNRKQSPQTGPKCPR